MHTRLDEPIRGRSFAYTAIECDWPIGLPSAKTERTNQRAMLVFPGFVAVFFFSFSGRTKKINEPMADAASGASFPAKINGLHRQKKNQEDKKETKTSKKRNVVFADIGFSFLSFFFFGGSPRSISISVAIASTPLAGATFSFPVSNQVVTSFTGFYLV